MLGDPRVVASMMGRTHAMTGALAGLLVGRLVDLDTAPELLPFAAVTAGYTLVPDLDHPKATASRMFGPITGALSWCLRSLSGVLYEHTKGPRDERCKGTHRHMTHTLLFALLLGGICAVSTSYGGPWAVGGWLAFGLLLAADRLGPLALLAYASGLVVWIVAAARGDLPAEAAVAGALHESTGWLGIAVALGCFTHCLGDALTESGCPFLFPLPLAGETWYEIRPPGFLRFRTGKNVEKRLIFPAVLVGSLLAVPGVWVFIVELFVPPAHAVVAR